ncbi:MAG: hypothetical protein ACOC41_02525 [Chitinivibrionales bacterium]
MKAQTSRKKNSSPSIERCCRCDSVLVDGQWQDYTRIIIPILDLSFKASLCNRCRISKFKATAMSR